MFRPMGRYHNAKRLLNRRPPIKWENAGTKRTDRAADPATVRLRCTGPVTHRFRAADRMRCPMCAHETVIIGDVP